MPDDLPVAVVPTTDDIVIPIYTLESGSPSDNGTPVYPANYGPIVSQVLGIVDVKDSPFNAKGDGVTDDSDAIQAAIDYAYSKSFYQGYGQYAVRMSPGNYRVSHPIRLWGPGLHLMGVGGRSTRIIGYGQGPMIALVGKGSGSIARPDAPVLPGQERFWLDNHTLSENDVPLGQVWTEDGEDVTNWYMPPLLTGNGHSFYFGSRAAVSGASQTMWSSQHFGLWDCNASIYPINGASELTIEFHTYLYDWSVTDPYYPDATPPRIDSDGHDFLGSRMDNGLYDTAPECFNIQYVGSQLIARLTVNSVMYTLYSDTPLTLRTIHHIALTFNGTTIKLWLDGKMVASQAASGTVTRDSLECAAIGGIFQGWPEGGATKGPNGTMDGIRFSKKCRYTADFTPYTTKQVLDNDTLLLINFDKQWQGWVCADSPYGPSWIGMRNEESYGGSGQTYLSDIILDCVQVNANPAAGDVSRSGIFARWGTGITIERVSCLLTGYGFYAWTNCYISRMSDCKWAVGWRDYALFPLCLANATGVFQMDNVEMVGGVSCFIDSGSGGSMLHSWIQTEVGTRFSMLFYNGGTWGNWNIMATIVGSETGGYQLECGVAILGERVQWFGGMIDAGAKTDIPIVLARNAGPVSFFGVGFTINPYTNEEEVIRIEGTPQGPMTLVGCYRYFSQNDKPWSNRPEAMLMVNCEPNTVDAPHRLSPRIRPLMGGAVALSPVAGVIDALNMAIHERCDIEVLDNGDFTIPTPINATPGQEITVTVINHSGGAMGTITWSNLFAMATWVNPANGCSRSIKFQYTGTTLLEVSRTPADVSLAAADPGGMPDIALWLKADDLVLGDGDPVDTWADASGNGNDFTQSTDLSWRPTFKTDVANGKPGVRFDGATQFLYSPSTPTLDITGEHSFFCAIRPRRLGPDPSYDPGAVQAIFAKNVYQLVYSIPYVNGFSELLTHDGGNFGSSTTAAFSLAQNMVSAISSHVKFQAWVNNLSPNSWPPLPDPQSTGIHYGATIGCANWNPAPYDQTAAWFIKADIMEIILFNRAVTDDERIQIEHYFAVKYGITISSQYD